MGSISLPPFLKKLQEISQTCDPSIAEWSTDGSKFVVKSTRFERDVVRKFFKGNLGTFIRQLHFYGFKKSDHVGDTWSFEHPKFVRDFPANIYEIRRKTRKDAEGAASKSEVRVLREEVFDLRQEMSSLKDDMTEIKNQLSLLLSASNRGSAGASHANAHGSSRKNTDSSAGNSHTLLEVLLQQAAASQPVPDSHGGQDSGPQASASQREMAPSRHTTMHTRHSDTRAESGHAPRPPAMPSDSSSSGKRLATSNDFVSNKRARDELHSTSSSHSSSSQGGDFDPKYLPFEDGANPGLDDGDGGSGMDNAYDDDNNDDDDFFDPVKKVREVGPIFDATGLDEFSDLFTGFDDFVTPFSQAEPSHMGTTREDSQDSLMSSTSSSSSSSTTFSSSTPSYMYSQDSRDASRASTPPVNPPAAKMGAKVGGKAFPQEEGESGPIVVKNPNCVAMFEAAQKHQLEIRIRKSETRDAVLPNEVFAGFLSKFVQQAILLNKRSMLTGDIDPELEIFVHASLPAESPLKDTLIYATPYVRTVLVNVLTEISAGDWQSSADDAWGPYAGKMSQPFLQRRFLAFHFGNVSKEVDGESWLMFLSFILKAAVNDDERAPVPDVGASPFMRSFAQYFQPDVRRVMATAQLKFGEYKRKLCAMGNGSCEPSVTHPSSESNARTRAAA
ncbi:Heat stress transcription factor A-4c [Hondaea fermentalgiana]|uniref:Heat stress transcription factor A-4c n=1 Tax=Hondaea fermentalgiana TaxID=2315210 RepID=A0A2R5GQU2_9STRA|nr:Heat stress transcription factor A-4c [Hondaea fermentalgiana]|eukprot:GBG33247.1 Heat stress transcription factor A-4c [Hondaea fermentalgiana]